MLCTQFADRTAHRVNGETSVNVAFGPSPTLSATHSRRAASGPCSLALWGGMMTWATVYRSRESAT